MVFFFLIRCWDEICRILILVLFLFPGSLPIHTHYKVNGDGLETSTWYFLRIIIIVVVVLVVIHQSRSVKFLLSSMLLWCPDKCLTNSCSVSNHIEQKQQLNRPFDSGVLIEKQCSNNIYSRKLNFCQFFFVLYTQKKKKNGFYWKEIITCNH